MLGLLEHWVWAVALFIAYMDWQATEDWLVRILSRSRQPDSGTVAAPPTPTFAASPVAPMAASPAPATAQPAPVEPTMQGISATAPDKEPKA